MATTTVQAFKAFAQNLKLTDNQKTLVENRKKWVAKTLKEKFPVPGDLSVRSTDLIGSAKRGTMIRPPDDIDLLAVFYEEDWWRWSSDSQSFLYQVKAALDRGGATVVGARGQAVRIFYESGPKVDVAPVFPSGYGAYRLPKGDGDWIQTDPDAHSRYSTSKNIDFDFHMKPFVQKLKAWNRAHSLRLKSFHLEVMVGELFSSMNGNSRSSSETFFRLAECYLDVDDPSGYGGNLAGGFSYSRKQEIIRSFRSARERVLRAREAESNSDHAEAIRLWRLVFGTTHFPAHT